MAETPIGQPAGRFPFLLLPLGKSYPLHQRLVLYLRLYKLARKPAKIAQEIQRIIYNSMLVTGCTQPGVPRYSRYECSETEQGQQRDEFPSVQILRVSKVVNAEATTILYSYNLFTALFFEGNDQLWDVMESFGATSENFNPTFMSELVDAVGHMFEPDTQKLPGWLFGSKDIQDRTLQDTKNWVNNSSYMRGEYSDNHDYGEGFDFSRFIRQIGPSNAAKIKKVQLIFGDLPRSADHLPLYAEILKQHVAGLEELRIGKMSSTLSQCGTKYTFMIGDANSALGQLLIPSTNMILTRSWRHEKDTRSMPSRVCLPNSGSFLRISPNSRT